MWEKRDIVAVSIPFSAGVITAVYLPLGSVTLSVAASLICLALACCIWMYCRKGNHFGLGLALFYLLGAMVGLQASMAELTGFPAEHTRLPLGVAALEALLRGIDELGVEDEQVRELAKALLTGRREGLDRSTIVAFRTAGAAHILSLSGLHMGIIYGIMQKSLAWLGRSRVVCIIRSLCIIAAAAFYTQMTGASPSVVRAFLFICINEMSRLLPGRRRRPIAVLCCALMLQLLANPLIIKSLAFQLSYLAILGIVLLFPYLDAWVECERSVNSAATSHPQVLVTKLRKRIWSAAALSISCQLFTSPLVLINFGTFPQHFLLSNLVAVPLTEIFVISIVLSLVCSALLPSFALPSLICNALGRALIRFLEIVAQM